jgi:hypothetical protein
VYLKPCGFRGNGTATRGGQEDRTSPAGCWHDELRESRPEFALGRSPGSRRFAAASVSGRSVRFECPPRAFPRAFEQDLSPVGVCCAYPARQGGRLTTAAWTPAGAGLPSASAEAMTVVFWEVLWERDASDLLRGLSHRGGASRRQEHSPSRKRRPNSPAQSGNVQFRPRQPKNGCGVRPPSSRPCRGLHLRARTGWCGGHSRSSSGTWTCRKTLNARSRRE